MEILNITVEKPKAISNMGIIKWSNAIQNIAIFTAIWTTIFGKYN